MFTIIGGDGKEYGPVAANQIREWIASGRANLDTKAKAVGTEDWRRLGDFAEFGPRVTLPPTIAAPTPYTSAPSAPPSAPSAYAPASASIEPQPIAEPTAELAGVGARTGAAFINGFIYFISLIPGSAVFGMRILKEHPEWARGTIPRPEDLLPYASSLLWVYAGLAAVMLVQCIIIAIRGQNIGKLIAGARVVNAVDGAPAGFLRGALLRFVMPVIMIFLLNIIFPLGLLFLVVDYCFIFRADRRCLHDLIAGTKVVKA